MESVSHVVNPTHTYNEAGIYTVTLVSSNHSYETLKKITITVNEFVSPDSDGDGRSNYGEKVDGTDPLDPNSVLPEDQQGVMPPSPPRGFQRG